MRQIGSSGDWFSIFFRERVFRYSSVRRDPSEYTTGDWQGQPSQTESRSGLIGDEMYGARVGAGLGLGVGVAVLTVVIIAMGNGN